QNGLSERVDLDPAVTAVAEMLFDRSGKLLAGFAVQIIRELFEYVLTIHVRFLQGGPWVLLITARPVPWRPAPLRGSQGSKHSGCSSPLPGLHEIDLDMGFLRIDPDSSGPAPWGMTPRRHEPSHLAGSVGFW